VVAERRITRTLPSSADEALHAAVPYVPQGGRGPKCPSAARTGADLGDDVWDSLVQDTRRRDLGA
jgi:hypothetical protein